MKNRYINLAHLYKRMPVLTDSNGDHLIAVSDLRTAIAMAAAETGEVHPVPCKIGDFSDGYHTFNELYHHRAVLFSVICNMFPEKAWKSKLHDTGDMYEGMFIVGIETEHGQATYHYDVDPYWDMFKVKELEKAPKWDGHTPSDAIERIGSLSCEGYRKQSEGEWISVDERLPDCEYGAETEALLFRLKTGTVEAGYFGTGGMFRDKYFRCYHHANEGWDAKDVTHWMPLPKPPKGD